MADFSALIQRIKDAVYENGVQAITGQILQDCLKDVVNTVNVAKQDGIYRVTVTVDNNTGVPSATARMDDDTYTLEFSFHNLKGEKGDKGDKGDTPVLTADSDGVIYSDGVMLTRVIKDTTDALTTRADSDHARADSDHARAESDHARAETDHTDITRARGDAETAAGEANYASLRANTAADNADAAREAIQSDLAQKQDVIPDLQQIRAGATDTVKYTSQSLTDAQKGQARTNIGAASDSEVSQLRSDVNGIAENIDFIPATVNLVSTFVRAALFPSNGAYAANAGVQSIYAEIEPGKTYTVDNKLTGNRFVLCTSNQAPAAGVAYNNSQAFAGYTSGKITAGSSDHYLLVYIDNTSTSVDYSGYRIYEGEEYRTEPTSKVDHIDGIVDNNIAFDISEANNIGYKIHCEKGRYMQANGTIQTDAQGFLSELIPTREGIKYKYTGRSLYGSPVIFILFDAEMHVLRYINTAGIYTDYLIEITEDNAAWCRFGGYTDYDLLEDPYAVYDNSESFYGDFTGIVEDSLFKTGVNLFDKTDPNILENTLISAGSKSTLSGYRVTGHILVKGGVEYKWPFDPSLGNTKGVWIVNRDGTRQSVHGTQSCTTSDGFAYYTPPLDCYIILNIGKLDIDTFMVCESSKYPSFYVPYTHTLKEKYSLNAKEIEEVKKYAQSNRLWGKVIALDGDSICQGASQYGSVGGYGKIIADRNNMTYENKGVGGGTIKNGTYSGSIPRHWICESVSTLRADADYIIVEGGVNDGESNKGIITSGFDGPFDKSTFCGGMEQICYVLNTRFAGKKVGFVLVHRMTDSFSFEGGQDNLYWLAVSILEKWGIPYCDLNKECPPFKAFEQSSVQALNDVATAYVPDGWHPNTDGYEKYYCDKIEEWMQSL